MFLKKPSFGTIVGVTAPQALKKWNLKHFPTAYRELIFRGSIPNQLKLEQRYVTSTVGKSQDH